MPILTLHWVVPHCRALPHRQRPPGQIHAILALEKAQEWNRK
jgi:hypothetical protein